MANLLGIVTFMLTCMVNIHIVCTETCLSCNELQNPAYCNNSTVCKKDEVCFLHKYITESGQQQYDLGCKHSSMCVPHSTSSLVGRRSSTGRHVQMVCESCCEGYSLCNRDLQCSYGHRPTECADINDNRDGIYTIFPPGSNHGVNVFCIMRGIKKWTVIQTRVNFSVNFDRTWNEYKQGFGSPHGEYWLGNENIHKISTNGHHEISFYLEESSSKFGYANYSTFNVGDEGSKYLLNITGYSGNTSDEMDKSLDSSGWSNGMMFTTRDQDHDRNYHNCARIFHGGWWYNSCDDANLNSMYQSKWRRFSNRIFKSIMMIRRSP